MMVGAILTQNTNWKNVEKALKNFNGLLSPEYLQNQSIEEISNLIKPSGFHNQKAQNLKNLCLWFNKYNFKVENTEKETTTMLRNELLEIKGVGYETADSILVYALDRSSFIIDAYTRRIFSRIGIIVPNKYDDFKELIEEAIDKKVERYDVYHGLIVEHAKAICKIKPNCSTCILTKFCNKNSILK